MLDNLSQFTGTTNYYRWSPLFRRAVLTDGTQYVAEEAGAYWLMDAIASHQPAVMAHHDDRLHSLQFWHLKVEPDHSAVLTCRADSGCEPAVTQQIEFTDFCLSEITIWVAVTDRVVLMLPSEY
jgi:hypothetical protein